MGVVIGGTVRTIEHTLGARRARLLPVTLLIITPSAISTLNHGKPKCGQVSERHRCLCASVQLNPSTAKGAMALYATLQIEGSGAKGPPTYLLLPPLARIASLCSALPLVRLDFWARHLGASRLLGRPRAVANGAPGARSTLQGSN